MELQVGVKVLLKNSEGKYLLVRRNLKKYPEIPPENAWDIVGGRINIGEPLIENLKREVYEETHLNLVDEPTLIAAQDILRPDKHVVRLTYTATIDGEPQLDEEHDEYKWFTLDELRQMPGLDQYFTKVLKEILK